jgi:DNA polymerase-3 subunit alpha
MIEARTQDGPFKDLFDFCRRVDKRLVNRRVLEALIRGGAFDSINDHRASLLASAGIALEGAEQASQSAMQNSLFPGDAGDVGTAIKLIDAPRWDERQRLQEEKQALGYYFSGHPFSAYAGEVQPLVRTRLASVQPSNQSVTVAGVVHSVRVTQGRRGRMAVVQLDDGTARVDATIFNELFEASRHLLKEDTLLIVEGRPQHDEFTGGIRLSVDRLLDLAAARQKFARGVKLVCNGGSNGAKLRELLAPFRNGAVPVSIIYSNRDAECRIDLGEGWRVKLDDALVQSLQVWLKPENVQIIY